MNTHSALSLLLACALIAGQAAQARDAARDLSRMVGYTIVASGTVRQVAEGKIGEKLVILQDGTIFSVTFLLLDPLPLTDVIVFAKPPTKEIIEKFGDKLPKEMLTQYKLLIDNEAHDATIVPIPK